MCDTIVATGEATADGVTLFGKNSDRAVNEAHHLLRIPAADHLPGSKVKCTHIEVPQVAHTYEVLLAKPFWIWGAEMGANEHGVTIGNEAVFTKVPYGKGPGLIGMDFIRLALERAKTASEALEVMISLLEAHGQGGNCALQRESHYHNSFIIADPREAWVFETAGNQWAAEQVKGVRTISNAITIGKNWDRASADLVRYAVERGWCKGRDDFHFGRCYSDFVYTRFSYSKDRQCRTTGLLSAQKGKLTVEAMMRILRDHGPKSGPDWTPAHGLNTVSVCWHAGFGPLRGSQSIGSMVSHLSAEVQTHFVTGTSAPCTSVFKPVWLGDELPETGPDPGSTYDGATLFWRHEVLHRATLRDYPRRIAMYREEREELERGFINGAAAHRLLSPAKRSTFSARCFAEADQAEERWVNQIAATNAPARAGFFQDRAWREYNRHAQMPLLS